MRNAGKGKLSGLTPTDNTLPLDLDNGEFRSRSLNTCPPKAKAENHEDKTMADSKSNRHDTERNPCGRLMEEPEEEGAETP